MKNYNKTAFARIFEDVTKQARKLQTSEYREIGKYVVIDQVQNDIAGYTDEKEGVFKDVPAIIFGDHTRVVKYVDSPCFLGADGVKLLKAKTQNPNYKYLYYALSNANIPNTGYNRHFKWLKEVQIPLPSELEQKKIVDTLDKISKLISLRKGQLAKLEQLVKSRFIELFGNMTHNTHGWDTLLLDECFEITSSKRILKSEWKDKGIPFLRVRDMVQLATTGKLDNEFFVSEEFYGSLSDSDGVPKQGDILMSATSTLGKCHVVSSGERFYFKDADVLRFRAKKAINPVFFMEQIKTEYIEEQIARTLGITTVAHFTIKAAKTINIRLPNIELQNQFAAFVEQSDKSKLCGEMEVAA